MSGTCVVHGCGDAATQVGSMCLAHALNAGFRPPRSKTEDKARKAERKRQRKARKAK